jgi:hypothetical protein
MRPCGPGRESIPCLINTTRREVFNTKARKETKIPKYILEIMSVISRETGTPDRLFSTLCINTSHESMLLKLAADKETKRI